MNADGNVIKIKHAVLLEVAKAAFAGNLDEIRDDIPFTRIVRSSKACFCR